MPSILIVDDLPAIHEMLEVVIKPTGFLCAFAMDGEEALRRYKEEKFDVALVDIAMRPMDGITFLKEVKKIDPEATVIMMTGYASLETAMEAVRYGAFEYIRKPFKINDLLKIIERAIQSKRTRSTATAATTPTSAAAEQVFLGESEAIQSVNRQIQKLASGNSPVLIQGERGLLKPLVAETLHRQGPFKNGKLTGVDCTLLKPETLREKLLGKDNSGGSALQEAESGILFVKDIDRMPMDIQTDLAHLLQSAGAGERFRFIASAECELEEHVDENTFSEELLFRIATLPLKIPPLRERPQDIPHHLRDILARTPNPLLAGQQIEFHPEAQARLVAYPWPGNIAEMQNLLSNVILSATERVIPLQALPLSLREPEQWATLDAHLEEQKRRYVRKVLHALGNDHQRAASILGIPAESLAPPPSAP